VKLFVCLHPCFFETSETKHSAKWRNNVTVKYFAKHYNTHFSQRSSLMKISIRPSVLYGPLYSTSLCLFYGPLSLYSSLPPLRLSVPITALCNLYGPVPTLRLSVPSTSLCPLSLQPSNPLRPSTSIWPSPLWPSVLLHSPLSLCGILSPLRYFVPSAALCPLFGPFSPLRPSAPLRPSVLTRPFVPSTTLCPLYSPLSFLRPSASCTALCPPWPSTPRRPCTHRRPSTPLNPSAPSTALSLPYGPLSLLRPTVPFMKKNFPTVSRNENIVLLFLETCFPRNGPFWRNSKQAKRTLLFREIAKRVLRNISRNRFVKKPTG
jgi:hypothetical protein